MQKGLAAGYFPGNDSPPVLLFSSSPLLTSGGGAGNQVVAAMKAYGLVDVTGQGNDRKVRLSTEGDRIVRNAPDRENLLKTAALRPPIHRELWDHFQDQGGIPPSNDLLKHYLVWDRPEPRFNDRTVDGFIADFRDTLAFAKLETGDIIGVEDEQSNAEETPQEDTAQVPPAPTIIAPTQSQPTIVVPKEFPYPPGLVEVRTILDEGPVVLHCPDNLSQDSVEELQYWFDGLMRRARRKAGLP